MENRRRLELLTFTCEENALPAEPTLNVHLIVRLLVNKKALNHVQTIQNKSRTLRSQKGTINRYIY